MSQELTLIKRAIDRVLIAVLGSILAMGSVAISDHFKLVALQEWWKDWHGRIEQQWFQNGIKTVAKTSPLKDVIGSASTDQSN